LVPPRNTDSCTTATRANAILARSSPSPHLQAVSG
jgi:hypothetical protein